MKILILTLWCLVPLGVVAFHYGPGRQLAALDDTAVLVGAAEQQVAAGEWAEAVRTYEDALGKVPKDRLDESRKIRLALAKARMESGGLPQAREELAGLVAELQAGDGIDPTVRDEALALLASSRFYMTYLMKLEGLPDAEWEPEIEAARQEQKFLLQQAKSAGDDIAAARHADDLEATIRLARMDPAELYGIAIPSQCQNCKSGKCNNPKPSPKPMNKSDDARGASGGAPMDGEGS